MYIYIIFLLPQENRDKPTDHVYESKQKLKEKEKKNFHGMLLSKINVAFYYADHTAC
jgi:hypothetical protein